MDTIVHPRVHEVHPELEDEDRNRKTEEGNVMEYVLASGEVLTDEEIDREAQEFETGTWEGHLERIHVGRPTEETEPMVTVPVRFPRSMVEAIDKLSSNRSDFVRRAVAACL